MDDEQPPISLVEARAITAAMEWVDQQWPYDPESASEVPGAQFLEVDAELLIPERMELRHFDGWRIGFIVTNELGHTAFVRDYAEDER